MLDLLVLQYLFQISCIRSMDANCSEFRFPEFEGTFAQFNYYDQVLLEDKLPNKPDRKKVYIVHNNTSYNVPDGWEWSKGNKSNKGNFMCSPGFSKAFKFKCKNKLCTAVKYVDTVISHKLSRVYYVNSHNCSKAVTNSNSKKMLTEASRTSKKAAVPKQSINSSNKSKPFSLSFSSDDEEFQPVCKKRKTTTLDSGLLLRDYNDNEGEVSKDRRKSTERKGLLQVREHQGNYNDPTMTEYGGSKETRNLCEDRSVVHPTGESLLLATTSTMFANASTQCSGSSFNTKNGDELIAFLTSNVESISKENGDLKFKVKVKKIEVDHLLKQKEILVSTFRSIENQGAKLSTEVSYLQSKVTEKLDEVELMRNKKAVLESKLDTLENEKQIEAIESQVQLLESLLADKENLRSELPHENFEVLKKSLGILSEKKKEELSNRINLLQRKEVSRNLFFDLGEKEGSGSVLASSFNVVSQEEDFNEGCNESVKILLDEERGTLQCDKNGVVNLTDGDSLNNSEFNKIFNEDQAFVRNREVLTTVKENTVNHAGNIAVDLPSSDDDDGSFTVGLQTDCPNEAESLTIPDEFYSTPTSSQNEQTEREDHLDVNNDLIEVTDFRLSEVMNDELNRLVEQSQSSLQKKDDRMFSKGGRYKVFDKYWENVCKISGPVPHGHSGAAVFEVEINNHSKISDMTDINDEEEACEKRIPRML